MARAVLVIADIGGYTRFMKVHRINLAHAQHIVAQRGDLHERRAGVDLDPIRHRPGSGDPVQPYKARLLLSLCGYYRL